jgi:hypothetical protein
MVGYIYGIVSLLYKFNIWDFGQLKNTIFWGASFGFVSLMKVTKITNDNSYFKQSVLDNIKLLAILQFVIGVYVFPFHIEFFLVPLLFIFGAMSVISASDEKYNSAKKVIDLILSLFGWIIISYSLYKIIINYNEFSSISTVVDFVLPSILTILYLPFVFLIVVYSVYEEEFIRLKIFIKNESLRRKAKLYSLLIFNFRFSLVQRWREHIIRDNVETHDDLINSFKHILKVRKAEKNPKIIPLEQGWSPYKAKNYLAKKGLKSGFYKKLYDEWHASAHIRLGDRNSLNNIDYYVEGVEGVEDVAKILKIIVVIREKVNEDEVRDKLLDLSNDLCVSALDTELSDSMRQAIMNGVNYIENIGNKTISLNKKKWSSDSFTSYSYKFVISSI